jgi:signal transduction histidine kinase
MRKALETSGLLSAAGARWRSVAGLGILLVAVVQAAQSSGQLDAAQLAAVSLTTLVISIAWLAQQIRPGLLGVSVLGGASVVLMLLLPGTAGVIGVIAAIVNAGLRLPVRTGVIVSTALGLAIVAADGAANHWSSPVNLGFTGLGLAFTYVVTASVRRIREERERAETLLAELIRTRDAQVEAAALGERARIAREIHDVLAHTLSALAVQLEGTRMLLEQRPGDPAAAVAVERAHRLAREGLDETRRAVGALRGDSLPGPDGLARLVDDFRAESGTPSRLQVDGEPIALTSEAQLALYRTAQEALTNVRKHARATSVEVVLRYTPEGAELIVEDVAPQAVENGTARRGYGLLGMRERAELVGGTLEAGQSQTGFRVRLWLPTK